MAGSADYGTIGPYRIVRRLGFGRKSEVLLATRQFPGNFERRVVIKRLLAKCEDEPERQAVLATEALAYARVAHPAIVQLFDFFSHEGHLALVLEYVDGLSLARLLGALRARREVLGDRVALFVAARVFAALAAAHSARDPRSGAPTPVIHRDVSPDNVLVPWDGFVKLGDFDLAKVLGVSGDTRSGLMKGTYGYMAPEQVVGDPVTPRTDVYAGCLMLRELLLARPSFDESLPELELLHAMAEARLAPIDALRGGIPRRLVEAMGRGLRRDPGERSLSAAEMVEVLRAHADMELAHAELIAALERLRPSEARGTVLQRAETPPAGVPAPAPTGWPSHTPRAMMIPLLDSVPPIEQVSPSSSQARGTRSVPIAGIFTAIGTIGIAFAVGRSLKAPAPPPAASNEAPIPSESPPAMALEQPPVLEQPPAVPALAASSAPTTGSLVTPPSARRHRVWIDGEVAAWSSGATLSVPCGTHVVRIGSAGTSQTVKVPCGGSVSVVAK